MSNIFISRTSPGGASGSGGTSDHGSLSGLLDDDHTQYHTDTRAEGWISGSPGVFAVQLDITATGHTHSEGAIHWNPDDETIEVDLGQGTHLQLGQEEFLRVRNNTGSDLTSGQLVYIDGAQGGRPTVQLAEAISTAATSAASVVGMVTQTISDGGNGFITTYGLVRNVDTSLFTAGDALYLSSGAAGEFTNIAPAAPNYQTRIGYVVQSDATEGQVLFFSRPTYKLQDLDDVDGVTPDATNRYLVWQDDLSVWNPAPIYFSGITDTGHTHPQYALTSDTALTTAQFTAHTADTSIHFTEASIDHGSIAGLFDNDHPQYRLTGDSISLSGDIAQEGASVGEVPTWDGSNWVPSGITAGGGVTDHGALTGLLDNDHPQYARTGQTVEFANVKVSNDVTITGDVLQIDAGLAAASSTAGIVFGNSIAGPRIEWIGSSDRFELTDDLFTQGNILLSLGGVVNASTVTATTISADTIYSANTNIGSLFIPVDGEVSLSGNLAQEGATEGDVATWDGTKWVPSGVTAGGGGGAEYVYADIITVTASTNTATLTVMSTQFDAGMRVEVEAWLMVATDSGTGGVEVGVNYATNVQHAAGLIEVPTGFSSKEVRHFGTNVSQSPFDSFPSTKASAASDINDLLMLAKVWCIIDGTAAGVNFNVTIEGSADTVYIYPGSFLKYRYIE